MQIRNIALVPEMGMDASQLARVSAALQKQVTRDLAPIWGISATVDAFPRLEDLPSGYWPLVLTYRELGTDAGIHVDEKGQPFALVEISPSWSLTASHLCLEMLSDPFGNRMLAGLSPCSDQGEVEFLADICDPCVLPQYAYIVNDVLVSDFCTPAFWEPTSRRERYSFTGAISAPLEILPGGQLRWYDPRTDTWWSRRVDVDGPRDVNLGRVEARTISAREFLDARTPQHLLSTRMTPDAFEARMGLRHEQALQAARARAHGLRASFGTLRETQAGAQELELAVQALRSRSDRPSRPQVFGALLRASLGAATAEDGPPPTNRHGFTSAPAQTRDDAALADQVEEAVDTQRPTATAAPPRAEPMHQPRTVPPPLPQTQPGLGPSFAGQAHVAAPAPVSFVAAPIPAPSVPPVSMSPPARRAPSGFVVTRDRAVAMAAVAAAVVLGVALHEANSPPSTGASVSAARPSEPVTQPAPQPARGATPPSIPTAMPGAEPVAAPTAAEVPITTIRPAAATVVVPAAPEAATPLAPKPPRARSSIAANNPGPRTTPEKHDPESLDSLIDDRR